ncbi:MAG: hypothetical protein Q8N23_09760 [Archangium sp.]|nr:hypothetical protein [Archangium sp.]MDP3152945.1 hypothetical protein [Archangium sp.]MDP3569064.1 hypothetical protein [Archangium sp.]
MRLSGSQHGHRRLNAVIRTFDEPLDRLTDDREVIFGLKAFLRRSNPRSRPALTSVSCSTSRRARSAA